jgi:SRSO17 transposase
MRPGALGGVELAGDVTSGSWPVVDDRMARWQAAFDDMFSLVTGRFAQADSRRWAAHTTPTGLMNSPAPRPARAGSVSRPARAAKVTAFTTGWCSISKPTELAYYICHTRQSVVVAELVRVASSRGGVEETFQFAKNETGLDHYQVRTYIARYRQITLSMLAAAFLAAARAEREQPQKKRRNWTCPAVDCVVLQRDQETLDAP